MYYEFKGLLLISPITETTVDLFLSFYNCHSCFLTSSSCWGLISIACRTSERVSTEIIGSLG